MKYLKNYTLIELLTKKIVLYCLVLLTCNAISATFYLKAQQTTNNTGKTSLLWEISGNGLQNPSYLYGTMHSKDQRVHELNDSVYTALNRSKYIVLEVVSKTEEQLTLMKRMFMKDTTLATLYDEKNYKLVKDCVQKKLGNLATIFKTDEIKPMFLITLLSEIDRDTTQYPQAEEALDLYLQKWGITHKKELMGLETIDEQVAALDKIPLKVQAQMLLETVTQQAQNDSLEQVMMRIYLKQDLDSLLIFYENDKDNFFDKVLVLNRNKNMADRLAAILQKQTTAFTAIGALHLPGKNGVIELLREKGYRVNPIIDQSKYWKPFYSNSHRFEVFFPNTPEVNIGLDPANLPPKNTTDSLNISAMYSFADTIEQVYYSLVYIPLDSNTVQQSDSAFFIGISERLLLKDDAYMVSEDTISYNGQTIYEGEIDLGEQLSGLSLRFWLLRNGKYAYLLSVTGLLEGIYSKKSDVFFNSFKLKK